MGKIKEIIGIYAAAGLLLALYVAVSLYIERGREIAVLQGEKSALSGKTSFLEKEIERRNKIEIQTSERLREIEEAAENVADKGGFDWNSNLPADAVTLRLRQD